MAIVVALWVAIGGGGSDGAGSADRPNPPTASSAEVGEPVDAGHGSADRLTTAERWARQAAREVGASTPRAPTADAKAGNACGPIEATGDLVAVEVVGGECATARRLAADYSTTGVVRGFSCQPAVAMRATCLDETAGVMAIAVLGPGGPDLENCGSAAVGEPPEQIPVRARSIGCRDAHGLAFRYVADGDLPGFRCREPEAVVICSSARGEFAFALPTESTSTSP